MVDHGYTTNLGASWSQYVTMADDLDELPKLSWISGAKPTPILYQAVKVGWYGAGNFPITQLAKIVGGDVPSVSYPAMHGFGGLGINPTMFAWYQVFAVDPGNPNHLIAPDVINQKMMQTVNGGEDWAEIPKLTSLVTNGGKMLFSQNIFPLASAVSFDPDDANRVAVGTWENGFFVSADGGTTWTKAKNSDQIPRITAFDWLNKNNLVISSYGRGLWRATFNEVYAGIQEAQKRSEAALAVVPIGNTRSPMAGKPSVKLATHQIGDPHIAAAGQIIELTAQALRPGTAVEIRLDGRIVKKASIGPDGGLSVQLTAPKKAGLHTLTVVDPATGKVTDGSMFLVRPSDPKERSEKE
jgi:hypothetical protein